MPFNRDFRACPAQSKCRRRACISLVNSTKEFVRVENLGEVFDFLKGGGGIVQSKNGVKVSFPPLVGEHEGP